VPRKLRLEYEGAIYHLMNRGDRKEPIFLDDQDRQRFVATLGEVCERTGWQVHAYCLMRNHFHLVVETPRPNLSAGMQWFLGTYTARFNRRHQVVGHLFSGRYKAVIVDGSGNGYLKAVCDYVHLNPVRANLLRAEEPLQLYPWSSYREYLQAPKLRPTWLKVERVLGEWGISEDSTAGRRRFKAAVEGRRYKELGQEPEAWHALRRDWCLGSQGFRETRLEQVEVKRGDHHYGEELREAEQQKAERLLTEMLAKAGWKRQDLDRRPKGDRQKARMAARLRTETTVTWRWIAEHMAMGAWRTAANAVRALTPGGGNHGA